MAVEIQKQKPMPSKTGGRPAKYPWLTMDVGDAFKYGGSNTTAYRAANMASKLYAPRKFSARVTEDRSAWIWRTA